MAIAFDNVSTAVGSSVVTLQWTHTAGGANTYLLVAMESLTNSMSAVYANNVAMTNLVSGITSGVNIGWLSRRAGVAAAALTMSAETAGGSFLSFAIGAVSYTGVSQATPDSGAGTKQTAGVATVVNLSISTAASMMVFGVIGLGNTGVITNQAGQTQRFQVSVGGQLIMAGADKASGGGTTSFSWTSDNEASFAMGIGFSATAVAAGSFPPMRNLMKVGK